VAWLDELVVDSLGGFAAVVGAGASDQVHDGRVHSPPADDCHRRGTGQDYAATATAETGVQIGLVNLIPQNKWFTELPDELAPGMVLINWRF